ncbi:extracellular solute-binding protein [Solibacillus sp. FSL R7-0668]|uniref:extracellular solute-binding protein n=1 Tax=Solibacillus sp. FSL R7-0668 TaxID=2921688 RepID=UPI0030F5DC54
MNKKAMGFLTVASSAIVLAACGSSSANSNDQVIIYSNADDEAIEVMQNTLNEKGFEGEYIIQSVGTSELGGKLLAEGKSIEADVVTMASYYIDSADAQHEMFLDLTSSQALIDEMSNVQLPILGNVGSIFINTEMLAQKGLDTPTSIKDLTNPQYKNLISIPNIMDSSTGWLLVQAVIAEYGEQEGQQILADLIQNVGPHLESSGSGPIKKVKTGEVPIGFGLRAQAIDAKEEGLPIDTIDPIEGNYSLVESVAVIDKEDDEKEQKAQEIALTIANEARVQLLTQYPVALYEGESVSDEPAYLKKWATTLTVELLQQHQAIFEAAKQ